MDKWNKALAEAETTIDELAPMGSNQVTMLASLDVVTTTLDMIKTVKNAEAAGIKAAYEKGQGGPTI